MTESDARRPPSRLGRFVQAMRSQAWQRLRMDPDLKEAAQEYGPRRGNRLTREGLEGLANSRRLAGEPRVSSDDIQALETGELLPGPEKLRVILRGLILSDDEVDAVLSDLEFTRATNAAGLGNTYLIPRQGRKLLAVGEYGPQVDRCFRVGDYGTTWVTVETADVGGFRDDEVGLKVMAENIATTRDKKLKPPAGFSRLANEALRLNEQRRAEGREGCWTDNETLCLDSIDWYPKDDQGERDAINLTFYRSMYRFNYIAKNDQALAYRWEALQNARDRILPVNYLASGVGVSINLLCDDGRSMIYGRRSSLETFRKGEVDVAVVEGIRAKSDLRPDGTVSLRDVCLRGLNEEIGLDRISNGKTAKDFLDTLCIFELGVDLNFYQWNFLAYASTKLSVDQIRQAWLVAKSRKENVDLAAIPFTQDSVEKFVQHNRIWSCGIACALGTFRYLP